MQAWGRSGGLCLILHACLVRGQGNELSMKKSCRWGILGTAGIARKNWKAIRLAGNAELIAVASRDGGRARDFIERMQKECPFEAPPRACSSYDELIAATDVDALYVPLPTGIRPEWIIKAAQAGKHVLSEKPAAANAGILATILAVCERQGVQFMDGVMFMHSRRLPAMGAVLGNKDIVGEIRRITSQFTFAAFRGFYNDNIRAHSVLEPLGCLGDLGWYNVRFSLWAMDWRLPEAVSGRCISERGRKDSPGKVPVEFSAELYFGNRVTAGFYCGFESSGPTFGIVDGRNGWMRVDNFLVPDCDSITFSGPGPARDPVAMGIADPPGFVRDPASAQDAGMIRRFSDIALSGKPDPFWHRVAMLTQKVVDACLLSARQGSPVCLSGG